MARLQCLSRGDRKRLDDVCSGRREFRADFAALLGGPQLRRHWASKAAGSKRRPARIYTAPASRMEARELARRGVCARARDLPNHWRELRGPSLETETETEPRPQGV